MEPNDCRLWTEPHHFKYALPSANMGIYLNRSTRDCCEEGDRFRIPASELSIISSKTFALPPVHLGEEVDKGRLAYATICDKSDCFGSTLLFFFVESSHGWSIHGIQFFFIFFLFWKNFILIYKSLFLKKFIFKHIFFLNLNFFPRKFRIEDFPYPLPPSICVCYCMANFCPLLFYKQIM